MEPYKTFFIKFDKESIKTNNKTNAPNLINQWEAPAPGIIVMKKLRTGLSVNSGITVETRASATPENAFQKRKRKKSLAMSSPRNDPQRLC